MKTKEQIEQMAYDAASVERPVVVGVAEHYYVKGFQACQNQQSDALTSEWQLCPKCNGDGNIMRYNSPNVSGNAENICDCCNGAKMIIKPVVIPPNDAIYFAEWINNNRYVKYWGSDGPNCNKWYVSYSSPSRKYFTTPELYTTYKQSLTASTGINTQPKII